MPNHDTQIDIRKETEAAMMELSEIERSALLLKHFEGHSINEVAQILEITTGACKQAIFRAIKKMRIALRPLVLDTLKSSGSESVRSDTLFMLGMSDDPRAQQAIAQIARDSNNPDLQVDAIHMLGISDSQASAELLAGLYTDSASVEVKRAVIEAYIIGDESEAMKDTLVDMLKTEKIRNCKLKLSMPWE